MKQTLVLVLLLSIMAARWGSAQVAAGGEFQINTYTSGDQIWPSVASEAAGNFVVVWQSIGQDGSSWGIFGQRYDASGVPRGGEFQVNTYTTYSQLGPQVVTDSAGRFVVVWEDYYDCAMHDGLWAQLYGSDGARRGSQFE